jgi:hypothetical protein
LKLGGPFKGSGTRLKVGAQYAFREGKPKPWIGIDGLKVERNAPSLALATAVISTLIAVKLKLCLNLAVPVPATKKKLRSFVGLNLGEQNGPYGVTVFNILKSELEF